MGYADQVNFNFPTAGASRVRPVYDGEAVSAEGVGEGDNPKPETKAIQENNEQILRSESGDERPPRAGEGISRAVGGTAQGVGSAASGVGAGVGEAVEGIGHAVKRVASLGEDAGPLRSSTTHKNPYQITDASMSWGRGGQTETAPERNAETIPTPALQSMGIAPSMSSATADPVPSDLGAGLKADASHDAGWTMREIGAYQIIG
jgi:hypothetical protein